MMKYKWRRFGAVRDGYSLILVIQRFSFPVKLVRDMSCYRIECCSSSCTNRLTHDYPRYGSSGFHAMRHSYDSLLQGFARFTFIFIYIYNDRGHQIGNGAPHPLRKQGVRKSIFPQTD